ncbi:MAG: MurR/RpiR family transcriptional regulator [Firmicutes bacterium]|nr:MurR/RpiR family transcriptional regulator [Bacillota bacterium]
MAGSATVHHVVRGGADDIFAHIERIRDEVSESMVLVADYLLKQREQVAALSISDITEACGVSKATVVRFCKLLGFDGFRSFKQALIADQLRRLGPAPEPVPLQHEENSVEAWLEIVGESVRQSLRSLDRDAVRRAAELMAGANLIIWFGVGDSAFLARSGDHRAMINGLRSKAVEAANAFKGIVKHLGDDDVVICISRSGRREAVLQGVQFLRESSKAKLVAITGGAVSPLAHMADVVLLSSPVDLYVGEQGTTLQTGQMLVMDVLIATLLSTLFDVRRRM